MAAYRITITNQAFAEMDAILAYIGEDSIPQADGMIARLLAAIDTLGDLPERCAIIPTRRKLGWIPRALLVHPYRVIYSVEGDLVTVRAVRHGRRRPWP